MMTYAELKACLEYALTLAKFLAFRRGFWIKNSCARVIDKFFDSCFIVRSYLIHLELEPRVYYGISNSSQLILFTDA
jgi:hypothetical protein